MNSIENCISKLQGVVNEWDKLIVESVDATKENATKYNREQMMDGYDSEGVEIGGYASYSYEQMKQEYNPFAQGRVDLYLEGDFQKAMKAKIEGNLLKIDSSDPKRNKLIGKYGQRVFGLQTENQKRYKKDINLYLFRLIKNKLK